MKPDSEMPHGTPSSVAYRICRATTSRLVCSSRLFAGARITSAGIRYSNIDPDHEIRAEPRPTGVSARPSRNQWSGGDVALARSRGSSARRRFGREQVVVARIECAVQDPEADREQLAGRIEQEAEVHLVEVAIGRSAIAWSRRTSGAAASADPSSAGGCTRIRQLGDRRRTSSRAAASCMIARSRTWLATARAASPLPTSRARAPRLRRAPPMQAGDDVATGSAAAS